MRVLIDLQGAQGSNKSRGIGRYSLSLAQALSRNKGRHEVFIALSDHFPESIESIREIFKGTVPSENFIVWQSLAPAYSVDPTNQSRRRASELLFEATIASVDPDYILITSLFEGFGDNVISSISQLSSNIPTAVVVYDLIPLIHRNIYLRSPEIESWYENKLDHMRQADLFLAISESSRNEAISYLGVDGEDAYNISCAAEESFSPGIVSKAQLTYLEKEYGVTKKIIMYTGGIDYRKNIERLISAFSQLPKNLRHNFQLAIVCSIQDNDRDRLLQIALTAGLSKDDLVLTGFIPDQDLLIFYRACELFVFPSWHEGFGLPALEAMKCGCAVIASNKSSLPEVIQLDIALFDPFSVEDIRKKIEEVLTDDILRTSLQRHGLKQAKNFNWDNTARRAWDAFEESYETIEQNQPRRLLKPSRRPKLAFFSPLPPEPSGISDYSIELIPELARYYEIYLILPKNSIVSPWLLSNYPIRDLSWFKQNSDKFDRILYHFGNSNFHSHMFDLLRNYPGVVVLHDFFLSGIVSLMDVTGKQPNAWAQALSGAHGWKAVVERFKNDQASEVIFSYPCNLQVLQDALGVIVHANHSKELAVKWYGPNASDKWSMVPLLRQPLNELDRTSARKRLGISENDFVVCSFGFLAPTKMNDRLIRAWLESPLAQDPRCHLVFVGQKAGGDDYDILIDKMLRSSKTAGRIEITGWTDLSVFRQWLAAADVGVQLRTNSRGETSAAVLDCMNAGLATIINANGSMAEIPGDSVFLLKDQFSDIDLTDALSTLWRNTTLRHTFGAAAKSRIVQHHHPKRCANSYASAIERYYNKSDHSEHGLLRTLLHKDLLLSEEEWGKLSTYVERNIPRRPRLKTIFVDVSELVQRDARSGVQRVVRSLLLYLLMNPPSGWKVEPIYAEYDKQGYRYARKFTCRFLDIWEGWSEDEIVEPHSGDIFVGLDLQPSIVPQQQDTLQEWRRRGVTIYFIVYDLLPVIMPEFFMPVLKDLYHNWLQTVSKADGIICISRSVADEFCDWMNSYGTSRKSPLAIDWFHLGADTEQSTPTFGMPESSNGTLSALRASPSFLMVGTIEPRKGHQQVLLAFEALWSQSIEINLVIIGKIGWMMDGFVQKIKSHPQKDRQLFWLEAISDEYLIEIYQNCFCLIASSEGEGFGLPIIEASRHNLVVLARDIPVFREVGSQGAYYFPDDNHPDTISVAIKKLLDIKTVDIKKKSIAWQSWAESAESLISCVTRRNPPHRYWMPSSNIYFWGNDIRLKTQVGKIYRKSISSSNQSGFLIYGPHIPMNPGSYIIRIRGSSERLTGKEYVDLVSDSGLVRMFYQKIQLNKSKWEVAHNLILDRTVKDFEVRVWVDENSIVTVNTIEIEINSQKGPQ